LGPAFLGHLYRRICLTPTAFLLVAEDSNDVVGFVAGSGDIRRLYRTFVLRDGIRAAASVAPRLVRNRRRVLETLRHGSQDDGTDRGTELLSIAVAPSHRGHGLGQQLVTAFLDVADAAGADGAYVVVGADNHVATALYRRAGFATASEFELHAGTTSLLVRREGDAPRARGGHGPP
jgi:ribosomal protein S18 acetylase RimI-like enzyme